MFNPNPRLRRCSDSTSVWAKEQSRIFETVVTVNVTSGKCLIWFCHVQAAGVLLPLSTHNPCVRRPDYCYLSCTACLYRLGLDGRRERNNGNHSRKLFNLVRCQQTLFSALVSYQDMSFSVMCVRSHLLPRGRVVRRQCGSPKGTWGT